MNNEYGLQPREIPKLDDDARTKIVVHEDKAHSPKRQVVLDAFSTLREVLLEGWEDTWVKVKDRVPHARTVGGPRPTHLWAKIDDTVVVSDGMRGHRAPVAPDLMPAFKAMAAIVARPYDHPNLVIRDEQLLSMVFYAGREIDNDGTTIEDYILQQMELNNG